MDSATVVEIHHLYARQSHLIDSGRAEEWARTFQEQGEFRSPTYPEPVVGHPALRAFAERFVANAAAAGEVHRHVVTNVVVERADAEEADARAYLQVLATSASGGTRVLRFTTLHDRLRREGATWLVGRREVRRDDLGA